MRKDKNRVDEAAVLRVFLCTEEPVHYFLKVSASSSVAEIVFCRQQLVS